MADKALSEFTAVTSVTGGALLMVAVEDPLSGTGYSTRKIEADDLAKTLNSKVNVLVTGTLTAGSTSITLSDASIDSSSRFDFYAEVLDLVPTAASVSTGSITLTYPAQASDVVVGVEVKND